MKGLSHYTTLVLTFTCLNVIYAQILRKDSFGLDSQPAMGLTNNTITSILVSDNIIWFGTDAGLVRTTDEVQSFELFGVDQGIGKGQVSALAGSDDIIWVATGFDSITPFGTFQAGSGLAYSQDDGMTWSYIKQPDYPIGTNINNITFDIALRGDEVWIASFTGGLRKSTNLGQFWEIVTPDSFIFDPFGILNHRAFSVISTDSTLWVGTAGGINSSTDGGITWTNFNHENQTNPISGNFVVALAQQKLPSGKIIWAATARAAGATEFTGVSITRDEGLNWEVVLDGVLTHNFGIDGDRVYCATDDGVYRTDDFGETWQIFRDLVDEQTTIEFFDVKVQNTQNDKLIWVGGTDGLFLSRDDGLTWESVQLITAINFDPVIPPDYYLEQNYPNPFNPATVITYQIPEISEVELTIYNQLGQKVKTLVNEKQASGAYQIEWNGQDNRGKQVASGVYLYRLKTGSYIQTRKMVFLP